MDNHEAGVEVRREDQFIQQNLGRISSVALAELRALRVPRPEGHVADVVSEVCITLMVNWRKLHSPEDALYRVTVNRARTYARSLRRRHETPGDIDDESVPLFGGTPGASPEEQAVVADLLEKILPLLNDSEFDLFVKRFFLDLSFEAIAAARGEALGTVTSRYSRALVKLREAILVPPVFPGNQAAPTFEGTDSRRSRSRNPSGWRGKDHE
jgi:RNA polymerase sigma factor (sigma-70 family)